MNTSPSLSPPGSDLDGLELESLRASREHAPSPDTALEWKREGTVLYALVQDGWRKGEPVAINQFMVNIIRDRRYGLDTAGEALAERIYTLLSSAKPAERESSRDELLDRLSQLEAELKRRDEALRNLVRVVERVDRIHAPTELFRAMSDAKQALRAALQPQEGGN